MPAKQLLTIFECILLLTVFALIGSFEITTHENDQIVDATESFTELIRYKGCITRKMYEDFREQIPTQVKVSFVIEKGEALKESDEPSGMDFTADVLEQMDVGFYPLHAGDNLQVIVQNSLPPCLTGQ